MAVGVMKSYLAELKSKLRTTWLIALLSLMGCGVSFAGDYCEVCGASIDGTVYTFEDKIAHVRKRICSKCLESPVTCYMCSMPVVKGYTTLPDGRNLCERDARTVVLTESEAIRICDEVRRVMDRKFSRFISFPETNVTISLVDRVNLMNLFQIPGQDYECPNVLGYLNTRTNRLPVVHEMSLLGGLPSATLKATFVHESAHTWVAENISISRRKRLNRNAEEGFCELVAFLVMDSLREEAAKAEIKQNAYTRGQFATFLAAEEQYGFNDIIDWMKFGEDDVLIAQDLSRVRKVETVTTTAPSKVAFPVYRQAVDAPTSDKLILKGVSGSASRRFALINDKTLAPNEVAKIRLGQTNILVRCLEVRANSVLLQVGEPGQKMELTLEDR